VPSEGRRSAVGGSSKGRRNAIRPDHTHTILGSTVGSVVRSSGLCCKMLKVYPSQPKSRL
jgi:hypothetical protein